MPLFGSPNVEKMKAKRDVDGLIQVFSEKKKNYEVELRLAAIRALGDLGDLRALFPLIYYLEELLEKNYGGIGLHEAIAEALGKLGDERAVGTLVKAIAQYNFQLYPVDALVKIRGSAAALDILGVVVHRFRAWDGSSIPNAKKLLDRVGQIGDKDVVAPLLDYIGLGNLKNDQRLYPLGYEAHEALKKIIEGNEVKLLGDVLNNDDLENNPHVINPWIARMTAAEYLGKINDPEAVPILKKALTCEKAGEVREAINYALKNFDKM